ncbi:hypothetical protein WG66_004385 [Moniliophthora roreri]|nr:hypothetical protein WG66_004385 [Moniliophthora roreri]
MDLIRQLLMSSTKLSPFPPICSNLHQILSSVHVRERIVDLGLVAVLQMADLNKLQHLHLTERCVNILPSAREGIGEAGDQVTEELRAPISKLIDSIQIRILK